MKAHARFSLIVFAYNKHIGEGCSVNYIRVGQRTVWHWIVCEATRILADICTSAYYAHHISKPHIINSVYE